MKKPAGSRVDAPVAETIPAARRPRRQRELHYRQIFNAPAPSAHPDRPLYVDIYLAIREKILNGQIGNGDLLPSESQLMEIFSVSRITVRRAVRELTEMGLVESRRGTGTVVTVHGDGSGRPRQRGSIEDLLENLIVIGEGTRVEVVSFGVEPAPADIARSLGVEPGKRIHRIIRVLHQGSRPLCLIDAYVTPAVAQIFSRRQLENEFIATLLHRAGIRMARANQTLSAKASSAKVARYLGIKTGSPLFDIFLEVFDPRGRPLEVVTITYAADRYQYRMSLVQSRRNWLRDPQSQGLASLRPGGDGRRIPAK